MFKGSKPEICPRGFWIVCGNRRKKKKVASASIVNQVSTGQYGYDPGTGSMHAVTVMLLTKFWVMSTPEKCVILRSLAAILEEISRQLKVADLSNNECKRLRGAVSCHRFLKNWCITESLQDPAAQGKSTHRLQSPSCQKQINSTYCSSAIQHYQKMASFGQLSSY